MRSFALATIFAMAASLKVKSKETGKTNWQDPAAGGMECANATFETISEKFTWGWLSIADLAMFTEIKCGKDCQDIDWNAIDWDFIHRLRDGWKDAFTNYEWNYVERSVEASKFADYVSRVASELGKGQADLEWLIQNGCKNFNARQARRDSLGQEYWDIVGDAQSESWAYCDLDRQEAYDHGFKEGEQAHFNATMGIFNGTNGTNSTGSSWDDSSAGGSSWDDSSAGGSSWDDSSAGGSSWDDSTMPPPPATGTVDCLTDPANPMCMPSGTATANMPPPPTGSQAADCAADPAKC